MASVVSPSARNRTTPFFQPTRCMHRVVQWFGNEQSTVLKVATVVLAMIAVVSIGIFSGHPFLFSLALIPLAILAQRAWSILNTPPPETLPPQSLRTPPSPPPPPPSIRQEPAPIPPPSPPYVALPPRAAQSDPSYMAQERVWQALGGLAAKQRLPQLRIEGRLFRSGDLFRPEELSHSIMWFRIGRLEREAIAVKVRDSGQSQKILVITFFPVTDANAPGRWAHNIEGFLQASFDGSVQTKMLQQIVVEKNHPQFTLV